MAPPAYQNEEEYGDYDDLSNARREHMLASDFNRRNDVPAGFSARNNSTRGRQRPELSAWNSLSETLPEEQRDHAAERLGPISGGQQHRNNRELQRQGFTAQANRPTHRPNHTNNNTGKTRAASAQLPLRPATASPAAHVQTPAGPKLFNPAMAKEAAKESKELRPGSTGPRAGIKYDVGPPTTRKPLHAALPPRSPPSKPPMDLRPSPSMPIMNYVVHPQAGPMGPIKHPFAAAAKAPEVKAPEVKAPEVKAPEVKAPEVKAFEVKAPKKKLFAQPVVDRYVPEATKAANDLKLKSIEVVKKVSKDAHFPAALDPQLVARKIGEANKPAVKSEAAEDYTTPTDFTLADPRADVSRDWTDICKDAATISLVLVHGGNYHVGCHVKDCTLVNAPAEVQKYYVSVLKGNVIKRAMYFTTMEEDAVSVTKPKAISRGGMQASRYA